MADFHVQIDGLIANLRVCNTRRLELEARLASPRLSPEIRKELQDEMLETVDQCKAFLGILKKDHSVDIKYETLKTEGWNSLKRAIGNTWTRKEINAVAAAGLYVVPKDGPKSFADLLGQTQNPARLLPPHSTTAPVIPDMPPVRLPPPEPPPPRIGPSLPPHPPREFPRTSAVPADPVPDPIDKERCAEDFEYFASRVLKIPYRAGVRKDLQPGVSSGFFQFTSPQRQLAIILVTILLIQNRPLRIQLLKARQLGFTTLLLAFWVWLLCTHESFHLLFLIDKHEHNTTKVRLVRQWLEVDIPAALPEWPRFASQPGNQIALTNKSVIFFESADSDNPGTSEAVRLLHYSEQPKWPGHKSEVIDASVLPGLAMEPMTAHINEGTAQGMDKFAHQWKWNNRPGRAPEDPIPLFFGWFLSPEYTTLPPAAAFLDGKFQYRDSDDAYMDDGAADGTFIVESEYARLHQLTPGQIYWRRLKINEMGKSATGHKKRLLFDQEFPTTPKHAFRASGRGYFPEAYLLQAEEHFHSVRPPLVTGRLVPANWSVQPGTLSIPRYDKVKPCWQEDPTGELMIWEWPKPGEKYYLGGDVAEGKEANPESRDDPDYTVFGIRTSTGRPVAYWRARMEPETCLMPLLLLGIFYNMAYMNVEVDGPGATLLAFMWETGYSNLLIWLKPKERPPRQRAWTTLKGAVDGKNKRSEYLSLLRSAIMQDPRRLVWEYQLHEYRAFVPNATTGKAQARSGEHDDVVMCDLHGEIARLFDQGFLKAQSPEEEVIVVQAQESRPETPRGRSYLNEVMFLDGDLETPDAYF